jgi:hypothetical protein
LYTRFFSKGSGSVNSPREEKMPIFRLYADGVDYFIDEITTLESGQLKVLVNSIQKITQI